jgi:hypothetical protein
LATYLSQSHKFFLCTEVYIALTPTVTIFHANIDFKENAGKNSLLISNEVVGFKVRQPQLCFVLVVTALELSFIFDNHSQYTLLDPDQFSFSHCKPGQLCFVKQCRIKKIVKNANVLVEY